MALISSLGLNKIKRDLKESLKGCFERGLLQSGKWATELFCALSSVMEDGEPESLLNSSLSRDSVELTWFDGHITLPIYKGKKKVKTIKVQFEDETEIVLNTGDLYGTNTDEQKQAQPSSHSYVSERDTYLLPKCYFDLREYDRAAHFAACVNIPQARFLHWYARYLSGEKKMLDDAVDSIAQARNSSLRVLRVELEREHLVKSLDGYCLYLYGVVLKRLQLQAEAKSVLVEAIHAEPCHWGSWMELASLITDKEMLMTLNLPDHWMGEFFRAHTYLELQLNGEAQEIYTALQEQGFASSTYIMAQVAIAHHNMRDVDQAIQGFQALQKADPYRLDNMDIFSNLLYVKEMRVELSYLAHHTCEIDKYRVETCCVIGNFYSLRTQHEKAVLYFQRALRLNPNYLSAWTLMGHEYMEMKNTSAAIQSYRQAIEVNRRDYRAWYGLGQTYEILKMPFYCLYYYRQAQQLRPYDSRMMVALGEAYEKLDKLQEAKKCFWKAHAVGDIEGMALIKLAKLYEKLGQEEQAAAAYTDYIQDAELRGANDRDEQCQAYRYLANYYLKRNKLEAAYENAQKSTEYAETREEGKTLLRQIAQMRAQQETSTQPSDNANNQQFLGSHQMSPMNLKFTP